MRVVEVMCEVGYHMHVPFGCPPEAYNQLAWEKYEEGHMLTGITCQRLTCFPEHIQRVIYKIQGGNYSFEDWKDLELMRNTMGV